MVIVGAAIRWVHLVASVLVVGGAGVVLLAGRSDRATALAWERRVLGWTLLGALAALVSGVAALAHQGAVLEARATAALDPPILLRVALETRAGIVALGRLGLLLVLTAFLLLRGDVRRRLDWQAARAEAVLLGGLALALIAASGHAAAAQPGGATAIAVDGIHLLATGLWAGGLVPLAALLARAADEAGADARPHAVRAARRFSRAALALVAVLAASGVVNAITEDGSVAALFGTTHGRLLLGKLALLAVIVAVAVRARRLLPVLSGGAASGRRALRRLSRLVRAEAALVLVLLAVVVAMTLTPPGRHAAPTWPLPFRLAWARGTDAPGPATRVLAGSQLAVLGVVALAAAGLLSRRRGWAIAGGLATLAAGLALALPPLIVAAYPTTYARPAVPYTAASIAAGRARFRAACAGCHGADGAGGALPAAPSRGPLPDLRTHRARVRTPGDAFWWIGHGGAGMPPFDALAPAARWDLVNYLRAATDALAAARLGPTVERGRAVPAPDFSFAVGPAFERALTDYRGDRAVLVVLYTLPASRPRLGELARRYALLRALGVEVVAVPLGAGPDAIRALGDDPPVLFPVVTDGAADIALAYGLFAPGPHAEFLVDRRGQLRAVSRGPGNAETLLADLHALNEEPVAPPPLLEHVH